MIQVRNVPDRLHRELVRRAARNGVTLTEYIEQILEREVARPAAEELLDRLASREPIDIGRPVADLIREERTRSGRS
jgi:antitoxin FitA